jgi:predicted RecB family nuclease
MSVGLMNTGGPRPPIVNFEERSVEDRAATAQVGGKQMKAVDYVLLNQPGSKDTVEREALPWLETLHQNRNFDSGWVSRVKEHYKLWKQGHEITPNGTHIRMWAAIDKAQADTLIGAGILTVEDLASANEEALRRVGIGARALKMKAVAWMEAASKTGKTAEELTLLRATVETQEKQIAELRDKIRLLARAQAKTEEPVTDDFLA